GEETGLRRVFDDVALEDEQSVLRGPAGRPGDLQRSARVADARITDGKRPRKSEIDRDAVGRETIACPPDAVNHHQRRGARRPVGLQKARGTLEDRLRDRDGSVVRIAEREIGDLVAAAATAKPREAPALAGRSTGGDADAASHSGLEQAVTEDDAVDLSVLQGI